MFTNYGYTNNLGLDPNLGINTPTPFSQIMAASGVMSPSVFGCAPMSSMSCMPSLTSSMGMGSSNPMVDILKMLISLKSIDASIGEDSDTAGDFGRSFLNNMSEGGMNFDFDLSSVSGSKPSTDKVGTLKPKTKKDLSPEFIAKVEKISKRINCDPNDLLGVMYVESTLDSKAVNTTPTRDRYGNKGKPTYATGLIQFMPETAKGLGTTREALEKMSPEQQLDYVEKYLMREKNRRMPKGAAVSGGDLYALIFYPAGAGKEIVCSKYNSGQGQAYKNNIGLDVVRDGNITRGDLQRHVDRAKNIILKDS